MRPDVGVCVVSRVVVKSQLLLGSNRWEASRCVLSILLLLPVLGRSVNLGRKTSKADSKHAPTVDSFCIRHSEGKCRASSRFSAVPGAGSFCLLPVPTPLS